jgi:HSP20 family protein
MTLIKHNNLLNLDSLIDGLVDNLFSRDITPYTVNPIRNNFPKVYVDEGEKGYTLSLAAPGVKKEDFDLSLVGTVLKLSYKAENKSNKFFNYTAFNKTWTVPDGTELEGVSASYEDGVFCINIVKPATTLPKIQKIAVK